MSAYQVPRRVLGRTGEEVSAIGLGGWHLGVRRCPADMADRIMRAAVDHGIDFFDNSCDYFEGESETRMGRVMRDGYRKRVFLMTKINGRTRQEAMRQLEQSLKRLQTDCIDLVQHHEILRYEDPHRVFADDGAQEALVEARKQGKLRYIGFTGHKDPRIHLYIIEVGRELGYTFDSVQMPLNVMDAHYRSFARMVIPEALEDGTAVLAMKTMAAGSILQSNTATPIECLHYALNLDTSVVIAGIDSMEILNQAVEAARTFHPLSEGELGAILGKTREAAMTGNFELFKTTSVFDGTATNPAWLGEEPAELKEVLNI